MKIAVFSDTHDNKENLKKALSFLKKEEIKILIHCGDVAGLDTLEYLLENFEGKIFLVLGNVDRDYQLKEKIRENERKNLKVFSDFGEIDLENKRLAFSHFPERAEELAKTGKYNIVFFGHLHYPEEKKIKKTKLVNPGNLANLYFKPTFLIYDLSNDKLELKFLEKLN